MYPNPRLDAVKNANRVLKNSLSSCSVCPRRCGADRAGGKTGYCRAGLDQVVYSYSPHHGEEPPISGTGGSGTIFFSFCNMKCLYCQNYYFSQLDEGKRVSVDRLAGMMIDLQKAGCHNINLVSPTHFVPQILSALEIAFSEGLTIPIVYNTGGYELANTIKLLEGVVDIYMPDMRYSDDKIAEKYSDAPDYVERNRESVCEMRRQVGDLVMDPAGIAIRGLLIRLLALPQGLSGTMDTLRFIRDHVGLSTYLSIMSQYYPTFKAYEYNEISRAVTPTEYKIIVDGARLLGLNNGWVQEDPSFDPKFFGTNIDPRK